MEHADKTMATSKDFDAIRDAYESVGARFLPFLQGDWRETPLRRRVAEGVLDGALVAELPYDRCEELFLEVFALGFESLYEKATKVGAFCGVVSRGGEPERAIRYLLPLVQEVRIAYARSLAGTDAEDAAMAGRTLADVEALQGQVYRALAWKRDDAGVPPALKAVGGEALYHEAMTAIAYCSDAVARGAAEDVKPYVEPMMESIHAALQAVRVAGPAADAALLGYAMGRAEAVRAAVYLAVAAPRNLGPG